MKVTFSELAAVFSACAYVAAGDGEWSEQERVHLRKFLEEFNLDDDTWSKVVDEGNAIDYPTTIARLSSLDGDNKQEVVNLLFKMVLADGKFDENEYNVFVRILKESSLPLPNCQEWLAATKGFSAESEPVFSNESSAASGGSEASGKECYYLIMEQKDRFKRNNVHARLLESSDDFSDAGLAKNFLLCSEGVLFEYKNLPILEAIGRELFGEEQGRLVADICKKPRYGILNEAAKELFGKEIYGSVLIRFLGNDGKYYSFSRNQCVRIYQALKQRMHTPLSSVNDMDAD